MKISVGDIVNIPYNEGEFTVAEIYYCDAQHEWKFIESSEQAIIDGGTVFIMVEGKGTPFTFDQVCREMSSVID